MLCYEDTRRIVFVSFSLLIADLISLTAARYRLIIASSSTKPLVAVDLTSSRQLCFAICSTNYRTDRIPSKLHRSTCLPRAKLLTSLRNLIRIPSFSLSMFRKLTWIVDQIFFRNLFYFAMFVKCFINC